MFWNIEAGSDLGPTTQEVGIGMHERGTIRIEAYASFFEVQVSMIGLKVDEEEKKALELPVPHEYIPPEPLNLVPNSARREDHAAAFSVSRSAASSTLSSHAAGFYLAAAQPRIRRTGHQNGQSKQIDRSFCGVVAIIIVIVVVVRSGLTQASPRRLLDPGTHYSGMRCSNQTTGAVTEPIKREVDFGRLEHSAMQSYHISARQALQF
ncbi:hypothetical protein B0H66DRAFT_585359 [Apodospora peruviana]|uniref:Uncharacterized protein n=1 Tax=Apodospora peruviana TaxID=516989 RepID=A0AAE0IP64_9PEZI|nr:hypothetical protein B0H66DRAFT_585359 [Apodospora peruviana]